MAEQSQYDHAFGARRAAQYQVQRHRDPSFEALTALWARLPGGPLCSPFQTPGFLASFRSHMLTRVSGAFDVLELKSRRDGTPVLLLPLLIRKRGPVRIASMPDLSLADQCAPVLAGAASLPREDYPAAWACLRQEITDADLVDFYNMPEFIGARPNPLVFLDEAYPVTSNLALDLRLPESEAIWRRKSVFKRVVRKGRRLNAKGVEFFEARSSEERMWVYETLLEQRRRRFDEIGLSNGLENSDQAAFYAALARMEFPDSPAIVLGLKAGDELVAANICMAAGSLLNTVLVSIGDHRWHRDSPGMVLMALAIDWAKARGMRQFSFGNGLQSYKERFGPTPLPMRNLSAPLTLPGNVYFNIRKAKSAVIAARRDAQIDLS
ncbi:MAG: GNAT family N-acetyltransferase [Roseibium sp.]|nr:GNAT family N-acetyltransferase [Roseibium sp.]